MNITLRQLRALVAVSRLESFTKAAELLHVTQPALTVQVKQLEEALDLKLLDRTTRQVKLTEAGKDIVPILQTLLRELDSVVSRSKDLSSKRAGSIRLGCLPSVAASVLPLAIAAFREQFPNVSFVLADGLGKRIVQDVRQETIEFGITDVDVGAPDLASVWLFDETMHVFYPRAHPIARSPAITVEELAKYPIILMAPESNARTAVDVAFASHDKASERRLRGRLYVHGDRYGASRSRDNRLATHGCPIGDHTRPRVAPRGRPSLHSQDRGGHQSRPLVIAGGRGVCRYPAGNGAAPTFVPLLKMIFKDTEAGCCRKLPEQR